MDAVRALVPLADHLPTVSGYCRRMLDLAMSTIGADAGAVLLLDRRTWKVAAGRGLRPVEQRSELTATHWLVRTVCTGGRGVTIKDTDVARQQLAGAPLASRRHLLAAPVSGTSGALLLGRQGDPPFEKGDLEWVQALCQSASTAVSEAVDVRRLALALARYEDPDD